MTATAKAAQPDKRWRLQAARALRKMGWNQSTAPTWKQRTVALLNERKPWWDWGGRLQIITGEHRTGSWDEPEPPIWYYRKCDPARMKFTNYPQHPLRTYEVIKDYSTFLERTEGLNEDEMYPWNVFCVNQDGDLHLGKMYWGNEFYGLDRWDQRLLVRYLVEWQIRNWFGLRTWLWKIGLHFSLHRHKPLSCGKIPPANTGGHTHWHCQKKKRHVGLHQYMNYEWSDDGAMFGQVSGAMAP